MNFSDLALAVRWDSGMFELRASVVPILQSIARSQAQILSQNFLSELRNGTYWKWH